MESKFADFRVAMAHRLRAARGDLTQAQLAELYAAAHPAEIEEDIRLSTEA